MCGHAQAQKKAACATFVLNLAGNHEVTSNGNQPDTDKNHHGVDMRISRQLLLDSGVAQVDAGQD
jgi:hypothetical protein